MSETENTALVQQAYALFGRGDIAGLLKLMSDDVSWEMPVVPNVPFSGKFEGPAAVGRYFAALSGAVEFLKFEPQDFLAKGDKVVVLGQRQIRTRQRGIEYGGPMVQVMTVQGGKLKRFEDFGDTAQLANAFKSK
jgi:uncharacterized protein